MAGNEQTFQQPLPTFYILSTNAHFCVYFYINIIDYTLITNWMH